LDEEIKQMRFENQLAAYSAQLYDKKRLLLEVKKNQLTLEAAVKEMQDKINELKATRNV
jgi:hypothetical protein